MIPLLIGLGINEISVSPAVLPLIKNAIRKTSYSDACEKAEAALASRSGEDIHDSSSQPSQKIVPEILELG